jgi:hypothetical protein
VGLKHRCELPAWCGKTRGYVHAGCGIRNTKYESRALVLQSPRRPGVDNSPFLFWTASNTSRYIVVTSKCADHTHLLRLSIRPSIHTPHSQTHAILWLRTEIAIPKREGEVVSKPFESARRMPSTCTHGMTTSSGSAISNSNRPTNIATKHLSSATAKLCPMQLRGPCRKVRLV